MSKQSGYKHEWVWDWPWHMAKGHRLSWFYMVNVGQFGMTFLHVRILGLRSVWTFSQDESRPTPVAGESAVPCPMCSGFGETRWGNMTAYKKCPSCEGSGQVKTTRSPEHR